MSGIVKFFNSAKGYGFIIPADGGKDVFVHVSALGDTGLSGLESGQKVTFATEPDKRGKGPKAVGIRIVDAAPAVAPTPKLVVDNVSVAPAEVPAKKPKAKVKAKAA